MRPAAKQREHCGEASGCGAGANAGDEAALPEGVAMECFTVYARYVPLVSRWGWCRWGRSLCLSSMQ